MMSRGSRISYGTNFQLAFFFCRSSEKEARAPQAPNPLKPHGSPIYSRDVRGGFRERGPYNLPLSYDVQKGNFPPAVEIPPPTPLLQNGLKTPTDWLSSRVFLAAFIMTEGDVPFFAPFIAQL